MFSSGPRRYEFVRSDVDAGRARHAMQWVHSRQAGEGEDRATLFSVLRGELKQVTGIDVGV